jgi:hypothetical protein
MHTIWQKYFFHTFSAILVEKDTGQACQGEMRRYFIENHTSQLAILGE